MTRSASAVTGSGLRLVGRVVAFAVAWWALSEGDTTMIGYGVAAVALATAASLWLAPLPATPAGRPGSAGWGLGRLGAIASLLGWFLGQIWVGGVDVARRVLRSPVDVRPVEVTAPVRLPDGAARQLCIAMATLMPGTVVQHVVRAGEPGSGAATSAGGGDLAIIHALSDQLPVAAAWRALEDRIAAAAGLPPPAA